MIFILFVKIKNYFSKLDIINFPVNGQLLNSDTVFYINIIDEVYDKMQKNVRK